MTTSHGDGAVNDGDARIAGDCAVLHSFRLIALLALVLLFTACDESKSSGGGGGFEGISGSVAGGYSYQLYVPESYDPMLPTPVVVAMHGTGGKGANELLRWKGLADAYSFIVLAPNYHDNGTYFDPAGDDAIYDMLAALELEYNVNRRRRYVSGYSTGGTWSFTFGIAESQNFAAGSVFSGGYTGANNFYVQQFAARQIPFYLNHGVNDATLPYANAQNAYQALQTYGHPAGFVAHQGGHSAPNDAPAQAWDFMSRYELPYTPTK